MPCSPEGRRSRPPFVSELLRIHFIKQWFNLSDPDMEKALRDVPLLRQFAELEGLDKLLTNESIILRFRHVLERRKLGTPILQSVTVDQPSEKLEHTKASIRGKVEHPLRAIKRQFGHVKMHDRGLMKNTAHARTSRCDFCRSSSPKFR